MPNGAEPVLLRITVCFALVVPSSTVPKDKLEDDRLTDGVPGLLPVNIIDCGLAGRLSEKAKVP